MPDVTLKQEVEITANIEIYCETCGTGNCHLAKFTYTKTRGEPCFRIEACEICLDNAKLEAREEGKEEERERLQGEIDGLNDEIAELRKQLDAETSS